MDNPISERKADRQTASAFIERRKHKRVKTSEVVDCRKYGMTTLAEEKKTTGILRNLGAGGMLIQTQASFNVGDVLKLQVKLPGWQRFDYGFYKADSLSYAPQFVALGTVIRSASLSLGRYDVAVALTGVDPGHQWALQEYIKHRLKRSDQ